MPKFLETAILPDIHKPFLVLETMALPRDDCWPNGILIVQDVS